MSPLVTVVVPTHNRRDFVAQAVESVLAQTFPDLELIVVDDGSDDDTSSHLSRFFSDPRLRMIVQENLGVSAARNRGAAQGRGAWLAFLDSDDLWEPRKLARQLDWLAENPGFKACYTDETWFRHGRFANQCNHHAKYSGDIFEQCLPLCIISPSSIMMDAHLYQELGGFDEALPACEDYDLWLRLAALHPVGYLPERLIIKRNGHEGQLSAAHWGLDRFRLRALWKLALDEAIPAPRRLSALEWIEKKSKVVALGATKRGFTERAGVYSHSADLARTLASGLAPRK